MSLYSLTKPILFSLDAETAHHAGIWALSHGITETVSGPDKPVQAFGVTLRNPIGLAAGLDKDGRTLDHIHKLGFGFAEVGTVTRFAQPGNDRPRLFRLQSDRAIINRMGFNNEGADSLARRFERASPQIPIGVNIGKSKVTELQDAAGDYAYSFRLLKDFAAYVVVNVSSPNTAGLRSLQEKDKLREILLRLRTIDQEKSLLLKIAPDLSKDALDEIVEVVIETKINGIIATNTTLSRDGLKVASDEEVGLSGAPLLSLSNKVLEHLKESLPCDFLLVASGGVMSAQDAKQKMTVGAHLVQVYSGLVYAGPRLVSDILEAL